MPVLTEVVTVVDAPAAVVLDLELDVDEQVRGPFRSLHHEHLFEAVTAHRTRMTDRMSVTAPAGFPGEVVARLVLAPCPRQLLRRRAAHVERAAEPAGERVR
ncbi:SRPBCC family protein [Kineococcus sp. SYSU DK004]|uniref:hypothetical protein n=1 Tax=Kineococcus sp. SYSU DK004 TaxID=3383125 RepID=UPI003D7CC46E